MTGEIGVDWKSATGRDGRLRGALGESAPKHWVETVNDVAERLDRSGHSWGAVKATGKKLEVADGQPGAEQSLRHFLESALLQANSGLEADDEEDADDDAEDLSDADRQMT